MVRGPVDMGVSQLVGAALRDNDGTSYLSVFGRNFNRDCSDVLAKDCSKDLGGFKPYMPMKAQVSNVVATPYITATPIGLNNMDDDDELKELVSAYKATLTTALLKTTPSQVEVPFFSSNRNAAHDADTPDAKPSAKSGAHRSIYHWLVDACYAKLGENTSS